MRKVSSVYYGAGEKCMHNHPVNSHPASSVKDFISSSGVVEYGTIRITVGVHAACIGRGGGISCEHEFIFIN